jgi:glutaconate CoA-transferase, subunit B
MSPDDARGLDALDHWTPDEMMSIAAARALRDGVVCFIGIGLPSLSGNLARRLHAPSIVLVYESGAFGAKPEFPPKSIGDGSLAETSDFVVSVPEIFNYWLQAGRIDVGFLGAAQLDRFGNVNTTVIGDYSSPKVRLPGAGGAPEIAASAGESIIVVRHSRRSLVAQVDFVTSVGYRRPNGPSREELGLRGRGPIKVITDLGVLEPDPQTHELIATHLHPGVTEDQILAATGWRLQLAGNLRVSPEPTAKELRVLRELVKGDSNHEVRSVT